MGRHVYRPGRLRRGVLLGGVLVLAATAVALRDREAAPAVRVPAATPPEDRPLYVDPTGAAAAQVRAYERAGRTAEAAIVRRIAGQPVATWFTDSRPDTVHRAARLVATADRAGKVPVLVLYNIPYRDCSGHSAGGARDAPSYRRWVASMAAALRGRSALVVLEPDAVAHAVTGCLGRGPAAERFALLAGAIETLAALPGVRVYLDAGNPTWVPADRMAPALLRAGAQRARGFALNVANFETTEDNLTYGARLSRLLGGSPFVIDTSRNGNGPARRGTGDRHWCNPPGRRLGHPPTLRTGHPSVDAYLWVKRPGESDGACRPGAPPAGQWYPAYALALAG
ncbi:glycoside hydrolase family 6 protein [Actinoplanes teichomyceticus]|uniref:Glucanase n=1 Tax=Actinoplanes teichomyceticus TaxID=1867 RepID=A0A561VQ75_ACTTI|nr:glycoside hydrolase family 6 protein [Actinoplanes teichomyceticus]TWG13766.1 endoglucanase [Actinoplanes teichomyceticus]GIF12408.1 glucanase [Actinoplanes teichomyceticus]